MVIDSNVLAAAEWARDLGQPWKTGSTPGLGDPIGRDGAASRGVTVSFAKRDVPLVVRRIGTVEASRAARE